MVLVRPPRVRVSTVKQIEPRGRVRQGREGGVAGGLAAAGAHAGALAEKDQLRAVFQHLKGLEGDAFRAVLDAPQQVGAGAGEPDAAVHGEEAAVGEVQLPGAERVLQPVCQGVLPVEVAADDGGLPPAGAGVQQADEAQQRPRAGGGDAELLRERGSLNSSRVVPSIWVISRPNAVPSWPAGMSSRAASDPNMARAGASPDRSRAFE